MPPIQTDIPEDIWLQFCFICCGTGEQVMDANEPCVACDGSGFLPA